MTRKFVIEAKGRPNYHGMMLSVILALRDIKKPATVHAIVAKVIENEGVTDEEQSHVMRNGKVTKLRYHLAWSCSCLKRSGDLEQPKHGLWKLTDASSAIHTLEDAADALDRYREAVARENKQNKSTT